MKSIEIRIKKSPVLQEVRRQASYTAAKVAGDSADVYAKISMQEQNDEAVLVAMYSALSDVVAVLTNYNPAAPVDGDDEITTDINVPDNFDISNTDAIGQSVKEYIVQVALQSWFVYAYPDGIETCGAKAKEALKRLRNALTRRMRPARTTEDVYVDPYTELIIE